jgi:hypothetical protein
MDADNDTIDSAAAPATAAAATAGTTRERRTCGPSLKPPPLEGHQLTMQNSLIDGAAKSVINAKQKNGGRLPYGFMAKLIKDL